MAKLSHVDDANRPKMVDVGDKRVTEASGHGAQHCRVARRSARRTGW